MIVELVMDKDGNFSFPRKVIEKYNLKPGTRICVDMNAIKLSQEDENVNEVLKAFDKLSRALNEDGSVEKSDLKTEEDVVELCRETRSELFV